MKYTDKDYDAIIELDHDFWDRDVGSDVKDMIQQLRGENEEAFKMVHDLIIEKDKLFDEALLLTRIIQNQWTKAQEDYNEIKGDE